MNPELKQYLPIAYILGGVIALVLLVMWIVSPKYGSLSLHETPFKENSHVALINDRIYGYSGAAFYSVSPSDQSDLKILASGMRLPAIKKLFWAGNKGALVVFDTVQTDDSLLEKELASRGLYINETTSEYVWYIDFTSKKLSLASTSPISSNVAFYSQEKNAFYFTTYGPDGNFELETEVAPPLRLFDISSGKVALVIDDIGHDAVHYVGACTRGVVCLIQDKGDGKQSLWAVEGSTKKLITNTYNQVLPTNNPSIYIGEKTEPLVQNEESEDFQLQAELFLINLESNKTVSLGTKVNVGANISVNVPGDGKKTTVLDDSLLARDGASVYTQTAPDLFGNPKSRQEAYRLKDGKLSENIIKTVSNTTSDTQLVAGSENNIYLLGPSSYKFTLKSFDEKTLSEAIKPCLNKYTKYHKYTSEISQMMVGVVFDDNFQKNIAGFSTCISNTNKQAFLGQTYTFVGLSPIDGRFVTN